LKREKVVETVDREVIVAKPPVTGGIQREKKRKR